MSVNALSAANAYAATLGRAKVAPQAAEGETAGLGGLGSTKAGGFADLVKQSITDLSQTTKTAEKMAVAGVSRQAELVDVVAAVSNAEMTLETVVAVRDKVINAYQEVMRMSI
jgi:flagellar hook-basal body complex protein FliE